MKERPLNFDYADETPVTVTDEQKAKLNKYANELKQHVEMLLYLIKEDHLQVGTRDSIMSIIDHNTQDLCALFDYSTYLKQQQEKTTAEIRAVNLTQSTTTATPNGIECINIIRHYTCDIANALKYLWRAGLKSELGKEDAEKESEDLKKVIFYIEDYQRHGVLTKMARILAVPRPTRVLHHKKEGITSAMDGMLEHTTGYKTTDITKGYCDNVATAMTGLMRVGLIVDGEVLMDVRWQEFLAAAVRCIQRRIAAIVEAPALSSIAGAPNAETAAVSAASPAEYDENMIHFL